jgi:hypothetical protein
LRRFISAVAFLQDGRSWAAYHSPTLNGANMTRLVAFVKDAAMTNRAKGTFDVKVIPQPADAAAGGPFSRLFLDKQFHGDLEATSKGQMLGAGTAVEGSAGYVALELVNGTLSGRRGSFILQHNGTMKKGVPSMIVTVVPDSGTDQLAGLAGKKWLSAARDAMDVSRSERWRIASSRGRAFAHTRDPAAPSEAGSRSASFYLPR